MTNVPLQTTTPDDVNLNSVFSAVRSLLIVLGTILAAHGYGQSPLYEWIELGSGAIMIVGPAAWGVWTAIQNYRKSKAKVTEAVNATLNLAAQGKVIIRSDGTALPATPTAAAEIVKNFKTDV